MDTIELLKKVRRIEIKTKGLSNQLFSGGYHSAFKGRGMSFSEVREYQYGDDVRNIDWNVTARFNEPFVKVFEEERELTVMLMIDVSKSAYFGTVNQMKNEIITEIAAVLSFSAINNNDKVGVIFFSDEVEKFIPAKKGKSHILRIIRELIDFEPTGTKTDLNEALIYFRNMMKKRSIAFILSDFISEPFKDSLSICNRKHDVVGIHLYDKVEKELPDLGLIRVYDAETGKPQWIDSSDKSTRMAHGKNFNEKLRSTKEQFIQSGADLISISTQDSYIKSLLTLFSQRGARS